MAKKVVLAYSGGLDTSVAVRWMIEEWSIDDVVCVVVDVGQSDLADPDVLRQRALAAGASEELREIVELVDAPAVCTLMGLGALSGGVIENRALLSATGSSSRLIITNSVLDQSAGGATTATGASGTLSSSAYTAVATCDADAAGCSTTARRDSAAER